MQVKAKPYVMSMLAALVLAACGSGKNADGLPTSLTSHIDMACDNTFDNIKKLPKQTADQLLSKYSKSSVCSCAKDKFKNDPRYNQIDGQPLNDSSSIYQATKKYKANELDGMTKAGLQLVDQMIINSINECMGM